jgi:hypothetical protein
MTEPAPGAGPDDLGQTKPNDPQPVRDDGRDLLLLDQCERVRKWLSAPSSPYWMGGLVFVAALLTLLIAHFTPASAGQISTTSKLLTAPGTFARGETLTITFGYLLELNHGFFFLFLAPIFIGTAASFLRRGGTAIANLEAAGYVTATKNGKRALARQVLTPTGKRKLRQIGRWPLGVFCVLGAVGCNGLHYRDHVNAEHPKDGGDVGYMQMRSVGKWLDNFNSRNNPCDDSGDHDPPPRWNLIEPTDMHPQLSEKTARWLRAHWRGLSDAGRRKWAPVIRLRGETLDPSFPPDSLDDAAAVEANDVVSNCLVQFDDATLLGSGGGSDTSSTQYWAFFFASNTLEGTCIGFGSWLLMKIVWWLCVLRAALVESPSPQRLKVKPLLEDPQKRFGLSDLAQPYNRIAGLLAIGACVCFFTWLGNTAKGNPATSSSVGWYAILAAEIVAGVAFAYVTAVLFPGHLRKRREAYLTDLRKKSKAAKSREESIELESRKGVVMEQVTWPKSDPVFKQLTGVTVVFVALPLCLLLSAVPPQVKDSLDMAMRCQDFMHWIAEHLGQLRRIR